MAPYAIHTYPPSLMIVSMNPLPAPNPTQARKKRDTDFTYHQIGTYGGIGYQFIMWSETAYQDGYDKGPPASPSFTGWGIPGNKKECFLEYTLMRCLRK